MTSIVNTLACVHCGKARNNDLRKACEHCHLRHRDVPGTVKKATKENRVEGADLVVVASDPAEMVTAQHQMIANIDGKIVLAERELEEARRNIEGVPEIEGSATAQALVAQSQERLIASAEKLVSIAERRLVYFQKLRAALAAGYIMMPNFPGHVIAIRTALRRPAVNSRYGVSERANVQPAAPDAALPPGEGKYVSPTPEHHEDSWDTKQKSIVIDGWDEEVGLPVEFLAPTVVQRTAKAIDLKIFDEIVLVRDGATIDTFAGKHAPPRRGDPMVIGRVILRTPNHRFRSEWKHLSFLIAWFMDTKLI